MTDRAKIIGRGIFEVFPDNPDDPDASGVRNLRASLHRVLESRAPDVMAIQKYDIPRAGSETGEFEERYWSPVNSPVFGDDGTLVQIIHRVEDVTLYVLERQQVRRQQAISQGLKDHALRVEAELSTRDRQLEDSIRLRQQYEARDAEFRSLANSISQLAWIANPDGWIYWYNDRWYEYTGTTLEEMQGWGWQKVHHPDHRDRVVNFVQDAWKRPVPYELTFPLRSKTGEWRWFLTRVMPIRDPDGRIQKWFGTNTDITEQLLTERRLESQREKLRLFIKHTPLDIAIFDKEMRYLEVSDQWYRSFGFEGTELRGKNHYEVFRDQPSHWMEIHQKALEGAIIRAEDDSYTDANGNLRCFRYEVRPWRDERGEIGGIILINQDITEQKQSVDAILRERELLSRLIERLPVFITIYDPNLHSFRFNEEFRRTLGWTEEDAKSRDLLSLAYPDPKDRSQAIRHMESPESGWQEFMITAKDGSKVVSTWANLRLLDKTQVGIGIDLRERRRTEERFRLLVESVPHLMSINNAEGQVIYYNRRWADYTGLSTDALLREGWGTVVHPEDAKSITEIRNGAIAQGRPYQCEVRIRRPDGSFHWHDARVVPLKGESGEILAWFSSAVDIEERKRAAEVLKNTNAELEAKVRQRTRALESAIQELESFSYTVSHDLRTPLRSIDGFSRRLFKLYEPKLDDTAKHYLNRISAGATRMGRLIDDLLTFSRISRTPMNARSVHISQIARDVISEFQQLDPVRRAEVTIEDGLEVTGDPGLLLIVIQNLLGNAWKYSSKVALSKIEFGKVPGEDFFFVRDNGAGFNMAYANKLFGAFHRLHSDNEFEGTGIGLATVRRILNRHGGEIWAQSAVDQGATFYFRVGRPTENKEDAAHGFTRDLAG